MAQINISSWSLAQMFGLAYVESNWLNEDSAECIYTYHIGMQVITRSDMGFMGEDEMHDKMAEEFLRAIGSAAVIK